MKVPTKLARENSPICVEVKRYGGCENRVGTNVEITMTLQDVSYGIHMLKFRLLPS